MSKTSAALFVGLCLVTDVVTRRQVRRAVAAERERITEATFRYPKGCEHGKWEYLYELGIVP